LWAVAGIFLSEHFPCSLPFASFAAFCFALALFLGRRGLPFWLLVLAVFLVRHDLDWRRNPGRRPIDLLSQGVQIVHVTGIVTTDPVSAGYAYHTPHSRFDIRVTSIDAGGGAPFEAEVYWSGPPPDWGDEVTLVATIAPVAPPRNPGEFDLAAYLARKGIFAELSSNYPEDGRVVAHGMGNPILAWARNCRAVLQRRISLGLEDDPEASGLVQTITLGLKQETSVSDRELFQHVGALHLFVVNGLHIALLALILGLLLKPLRIHRRAFAAVIIPTLFCYALITGLNPGSVRAAIMAAVMFGASFVDRRSFSINSLAAAGIVLLCWDTNELFQEGAQFSFGVVAAIILLADLIERPILPLGLPDPFLPRSLWTPWQQARDFGWRRISGLAAVSIAASLGSFPFSAGYFNLITPSGFLANLLLVPMAGGILAEGIFSLMTSWANGLALLFNNTNWLIARGMLAFVHFCAFLPGGYFFVPTSSGPSGCRITVLDLNPGQSIVIETQGACWLVDCGSSYTYFRTVRPYLQSRGINRLDGFIMTYGAAGSIGAAQEVIGDYNPRKIIESALKNRSVARRSVDAMPAVKTFVEAGDKFPLSPMASCTVLFPPAGFEGRTAADKSLVLRIEAEGSRVLLMSDTAFTGEHWLLDHTHDLHASVVVIGGQSADLAGTDEFIGAAHPVAAIRGAANYTAPAGQDRHWAGGLYKMGVTPFLQSETGAVTIDLTPSRTTLSGFMNRQHLAGPPSMASTP
jgi:ComEC/Rec2-related protein